MKKNVSPLVVVAALVITVALLALVGSRMINPQREENVDPAEMRRHMMETMQQNARGSAAQMQPHAPGGAAGAPAAKTNP